MIGRVSPLLALALVPLLSGCVAALLPLVAAGALGKSQVDRNKAKKDLIAIGALDLNLPSNGKPAEVAKHVPEKPYGKDYVGQGGGIEVEGLNLGKEQQEYLSRFFNPVNRDIPLPYADFTRFAVEQSVRVAAGEGVNSVVLMPRFALESPEMMACAGKPLAVLIDLDPETETRWFSADTLYRQNGLAGALAQLRASEISVIWLSDQSASASDRVASILKEAGFSASEADDFLFLDRGADDRKQVRRWDAARNYCIVAMAGDERADFDELYDYLRRPDGAITLEHMFGQGWFLTPPPLIVKSEDDNMETLNIEQDDG